MNQPFFVWSPICVSDRAISLRYLHCRIIGRPRPNFVYIEVLLDHWRRRHKAKRSDLFASGIEARRRNLQHLESINTDGRSDEFCAKLNHEITHLRLFFLARGEL